MIIHAIETVLINDGVVRLASNLSAAAADDSGPPHLLKTKWWALRAAKAPDLLKTDEWLALRVTFDDVDDNDGNRKTAFIAISNWPRCCESWGVECTAPGTTENLAKECAEHEALENPTQLKGVNVDKIRWARRSELSKVFHCDCDIEGIVLESDAGNIVLYAYADHNGFYPDDRGRVVRGRWRAGE